MTQKRALKFLNDLDSPGHFWFSNKQPLNRYPRDLGSSRYRLNANLQSRDIFHCSGLYLLLGLMLKLFRIRGQKVEKG